MPKCVEQMATIFVQSFQNAQRHVGAWIFSSWETVVEDSGGVLAKGCLCQVVAFLCFPLPL